LIEAGLQLYRIADGSLKAISSSGGFSSIPHSEKAVAEAYRVLTSPGHLVARELN